MGLSDFCTENSNEALVFEKKFHYEKNSDWEIPIIEQFSSESYQFESLQNLKIKLDSVKSKLDQFDSEEWSNHVDSNDPSCKIVETVERETENGFAGYGWCMMFQCLHQFPVVPHAKLNSLHLCEGPGAFIAALNDYLYTKFDEKEIQWNWLATSLNPYYEGNDVAKIFDKGFINHTFNNWSFHSDFTGDIVNEHNIQNIKEQCSLHFQENDIHLITADGALNRYNTLKCQEDMLSTLKLAEICTALSILADKGTFVLTMFTLFNSTSVSNLYLLNCLFDAVHVFKPAISKFDNSKVFIVCLGFKKSQMERNSFLLETMLTELTSNNLLPMFRHVDIPRDFLEQHEACCSLFTNYQIAAIEANIESYTNSETDFQSIQFDVADEFLRRFQIETLDPEKILYSCQIKIPTSEPKEISFDEIDLKLQNLKNGSIEDKCIIRDVLLDLKNSLNLFYGEKVIWARKYDVEFPIKLNHGQPVKELLNSLFIKSEMIVIQNSLKQIFQTDPQWSQAPGCIFNNGFEVVCLDNKNTFSDIQKHFFSTTLQAIVDQLPQRLTFKNYVFSSHYSVSILRYLFANMFEKLCFRTKPTFEIVLENCEYSENNIELLKSLANLIQTDENIHCFVDILQLHEEDFIYKISQFNNTLLFNKFNLILGNIEDEDKSETPICT